MIEEPQVTESAETLMAFIPVVVAREEIQHVMGPAIQEIYMVLRSQGIPPVGPWFTHHRRRPTETFDFNVCVPVGSEVAGEGRVQGGKREAVRVARTMYQGPYEGLAGAWGEFCEWIEEKGYTPREDLWECYVVGPESGKGSGEWRTELNRPLAG